MKRIGILTFWDFPSGMAPTTRIIAYSKGLVANNCSVNVYLFTRVFKDELKREEMSGDIEGIKYRYLHRFQTGGRTNKFIRYADEFVLRAKIVWQIFRDNLSSNFDYFLCSFDSINDLSAYGNLLDRFRFKKIFVADEFPIPIRGEMKDRVPEDLLQEYRKLHLNFSGRILMTEALKSFYNSNIDIKPTFILNTIVDAARFQRDFDKNSDVKIICYMGNMDLTKDDVDNIISAFSLLDCKHHQLELHLYGEPSAKEREILKSQISKLNLKQYVHLKGRASYDEVPEILMKSHILVNSQPNTQRAKGGFPTKLGEYLLSGVPSVFTDSGDIATYVIDGTHTHLVSPERPDLYADKLAFVLENYSLSERIASTGRDFVQQEFDSKSQTKNLLDFLDKV
jgi:glycosyltransferase involved in cell wall biosynthesis